MPLPTCKSASHLHRIQQLHARHPSSHVTAAGKRESPSLKPAPRERVPRGAVRGSPSLPIRMIYALLLIVYLSTHPLINMKLFSGESHTREAFDDAQRALQDEADSNAREQRRFEERRASHQMSELSPDPPRAPQYRGEARDRLRQLMESGTKEALELNSRYEALRARADRALSDLDSFEREALGKKADAPNTVDGG